MLEKLMKQENRIKDSFIFSGTIIGAISTVSGILGYSLGDALEKSPVLTRLIIVIVTTLCLAFIKYAFIGWRFKNSITLTIQNTAVEICCGNIFDIDGLRVIGCDTRFDMRVDDIVISKSSLHGQLVLNHGKTDEIKAAIEQAAQRLHLLRQSDGFYHFPLGSIIKYTSSVDGKTYLMLAMTELDENYKAYTNMAKFESMLMQMWAEIDRVYARETVVLPLLGTGISRFDNGKDRANLLRCMLCTMNQSGVNLNCNVKIVIYGNAQDIPLYEYKNLF